MLACVYSRKGKFLLTRRPRPSVVEDGDAVVRITLTSICTSDLHIMHGSVPRAVPGIVVGHEAVGVVEEVGSAVRGVRPGDRVAIGVETFCGECFFCRRGSVNNCTLPDGGWALGCRIDGLQAGHARIPHADTGLTRIPDGVDDKAALLTGDILATGMWAADIADIEAGSTVLVIGAGPTGCCAVACAALHSPRHIIVTDIDPARLRFVKTHFPGVTAVPPEELPATIAALCSHGGADSVIEAAGTPETFRAAWQYARPAATVAVIALYDEAQTLPLPDMYGKNLVFKTGGVDGNKCGEILSLIADGKLDVSPLITHTFPLSRADEAYRLFAEKADGVMKVALVPDDEIGAEEIAFSV